MSRSLRLDIPLLLPEVEDDQDACVARLVSLLEARNGIERVHVTHGEGGESLEHEVGQHPSDVPASAGALCLHFDPERISISQITDIARRTGATVAERYAHEIIPFRSIGSEDDGAAIEAALRSLPGVTAATVNFAAQVARVEYDREHATHADILTRLADAGAPATLEARTRSAPAGTPSDRAAGQGTSAPSEPSSWYRRNHELAWSLIAGVFTLAGWTTARADAPHGAVIGLYVVAY